MNKIFRILRYFDFDLDSFKLRNKTFVLHNLILIIVFSFIYKYVAKNYGSKEDKKNYKKIEDCFYYTCITQFGVGYGDISPKSRHMRYTCIIHLLFVFLVILY